MTRRLTYNDLETCGNNENCYKFKCAEIFVKANISSIGTAMARLPDLNTKPTPPTTFIICSFCMMKFELKHDLNY